MKSTARLRLRTLLLKPPTLLGGLRQADALDKLILDNTLPSWDILAEVLLSSPDDRLRRRIWRRWQAEVQRGNREAVKGLCRAVMAYDAPALQRYCLDHGTHPQDEASCALFYFLTEQWDAYESLDFDHRRLREAYLRAELKGKHRVMELARRTGRIAWLSETVADRGSIAARRLTLREWETILTARWDDLWRLSQVAPLAVGWRILRGIPKDWMP